MIEMSNDKLVMGFFIGLSGGMVITYLTDKLIRKLNLVEYAKDKLKKYDTTKVYCIDNAKELMELCIRELNELEYKEEGKRFMEEWNNQFPSNRFD